MQKALSRGALVLLFFGCDDAPAIEPIPPGIQAPAAAASARAEATPAAPTDPCSLLSTDTIAGLAGLPGGVEVSASVGATGTSCGYSWTNPAFDRDAYMTHVMQKLQKRGVQQGLLDELTSPELMQEFTLRLEDRPEPNPKTPEQAKTDFDGIVHFLENGLRVQPEGGEAVEFRAPGRLVEGAGEHAHWAPRYRQLTAVAGTRVIVVISTVSADEEANLEMAKKVAEARFALD